MVAPNMTVRVIWDEGRCNMADKAHEQEGSKTRFVILSVLFLEKKHGVAFQL